MGRGIYQGDHTSLSSEGNDLGEHPARFRRPQRVCRPEIRQVGQIALRGLPAQAEIDLDADAAHAGAVVAEDVDLPAAGLQCVAPFGLALLASSCWLPPRLQRKGLSHWDR